MTNDHDRRQHSDPTPTGDQLGEILGTLAAAMIAWGETTGQITAPVDIPRREDMRIQLVPLTSVERLEGTEPSEVSGTLCGGSSSVQYLASSPIA